MSKVSIEKVITWLFLFFVIAAAFFAVTGEYGSRCQYVEEIDDFVCNDPVYG